MRWVADIRSVNENVDELVLFLVNDLNYNEIDILCVNQNTA